MFSRHPWLPIVTIPLGVVGGFLLSAIVTYMMPRKYESEAIIEIASQHAPQTGQPDKREAATVNRHLIDQDALIRVMDALELTQRWNLDPNTCIQQLKAIVQVESIRDTDLISIKCRHTNKIDARDIANEVVTAYSDRCNQTKQIFAAAMLDQLQEKMRDQEERVEERRKVLSILLKSKDNPAANPDTPTMPVNPSDIADAKREYETSAALLEQLKLKQIAETISAKIPSEGGRIHSPALVAESPVSPKVTLNLVIGTAAGFFAGILLTLLIAPLLGTKDPQPPKIPH